MQTRRSLSTTLSPLPRQREAASSSVACATAQPREGQAKFPLMSALLLRILVYPHAQPLVPLIFVVVCT